MTVEYNQNVSTSRGFGNLCRLLVRWKGSAYKLVFWDTVIYVILYFAIFALYRFYFINDPTHKEAFESLVRYCAKHVTDVHLTLLEGFYIAIVVERWWAQFMACPWPDSLCIMLATHLEGGSRSRLMRRTIMRYVNLSFVLTMIQLSPQARKRFPTMDDIVVAGLLMPHEKEIIESLTLSANVIDKEKYAVTIPLVWTSVIIQRARRENRIGDARSLEKIILELDKFRGGLCRLIDYQRINIPLHYTQLSSIVLYLYFVVALIGRQFLVDSQDLYFPIFLLFEYFVFMGWFRVSQSMFCPWGEDDDDFEVNWLIDRNVQISYLVVDGMHDEIPEMLQDSYWNEVVPEDLPYSDAAIKYKKADQGQGSTEGVKVDPEAELFVSNAITQPFIKSIGYYTGSITSVGSFSRFSGGKQEGDVPLVGQVEYSSLVLEPSEQNGPSNDTARTLPSPPGRGSLDSIDSVILKDQYKIYLEKSFVPFDQDEDEQKVKIVEIPARSSSQH